MHELSVDEIAANEGVDFADGVYPEFAVLERERLGDYSQETIHKRIHDTRQGLIHANAFAKGAGLSRAQRLAAVRFAREEYWDNDYDIPLIEALRLVVEVRWTGVHGSDAHLVALRLHREQEHLDRAERRRKHFEAQARLGEALGRRALPSVRASVTRAQAACSRSANHLLLLSQRKGKRRVSSPETKIIGPRTRRRGAGRPKGAPARRTSGTRAGPSEPAEPEPPSAVASKAAKR